LQGASAFRNRVTQIEDLQELLDVCAAFYGAAKAHTTSEEIEFSERTALG